MNNFFSFCSQSNESPLYFDQTIRKDKLHKDINYETDNHDNILKYFNVNNPNTFNKYIYNPFNKQLVLYEMCREYNIENIKKFCDALDFKTIVPELIIKPVINPFDRNKLSISIEDIHLLKMWDGMGEISRQNIINKEKNVEKVFLHEIIRSEIVKVVGKSVWGIVRDLVLESTKDKAPLVILNMAPIYISTFFNIKMPYDLFPAIKLWENGIVPFFHNNEWELYGADAKVIWKGKI